MKKKNELLLLSFMLWGAWRLAKHSGEKKNEVKTEINNYNIERKKKGVDVLQRVHVPLKKRLLPSVVEIHQ